MSREKTIELAVALAALVAAVGFGALVETGALRDGLIRLCSLGLFAVSLNLLVGYSGLLSFGHAVFYAIGAYSFCLFLRGGSMGIPAAALASLGIAAGAAVLIGAVCIRLTKVYFAFLTLAFQMLCFSLIVAWGDLTGGEQGLVGGVPRPVFLGVDLTRPAHYFVFNVVVFVVCLAIMRQIVRSPFGAAMRMVRDNPQRALFLGVDIQRVKLAAFVIASVFSAIAGMLMSLYVSGAYPNFAHWTMSGEGLFMIMLGGMSVFLGPAIGAAFLLVLDSLINAHTSHHGLVLGAAILLTALGLRKGLVDFVVDALDRRRLAREVAP